MVTRQPALPFPIVAWFERRTPKQWRLAAAVATVFVVGLVVRLLASVVLDRWWFETVTTAAVWSTQVRAQATVSLLATGLAAVILVPVTRSALWTPPAPDNFPNRIVVRYRERMAAAHGWLIYATAAIVIAKSGIGAMTRWKQWELFLHGPDTGTVVPYLGWDVGYHLFRLPFLLLVSQWLQLILAVAGAIALIGYMASGALKIPRAGRRSAPVALKRLGLLSATYALVQAATYFFVRWPSLGTNQSGRFDGPGFTELRVVVPALWVLTGVAVIVAALMVLGVVTSRWRPGLIAIFVWGILHVLLLSALPALVTAVVVAPAEGDRQLPYIAQNLAATTEAYSLGSVEQTSVRLNDGFGASIDPDLQPDLARIPLLSESQTAAPLQVLQGTTATRIHDVDLDRYAIDGVDRPVLVAARSSNRSDLPERGWVQMHLVYTHGDGVVAVPADVLDPNGRPDVAALADKLVTERPELYFGEGLAGWYAIVDTKRTEVGSASFSGNTGIALSSVWRRAALGLAVGDIDPVVSSELTDASQLLYRRDLRERLLAVAPFLSFDSDPYPVVTPTGITWIVDGYTSASTYPYAQFARSVGLPDSSGLAKRSFNFMHASVKATVDAYDGSVHLYQTEVGASDDPILAAWSQIFPSLIEPIDNMPAELRAHLLYPDDLLTVQTSLLGRYHVADASTLFSGADSWIVSASVGDGVGKGQDGSGPAGYAPAVSLFMPASEPLGGHWVAIRPFGIGSVDNPAAARDELAAFAIADHDNPERLRLVRVEVSPGHPVSSPRVAQAAIDTDGDLAALFTLLNANGSAVQFGPMTPVLVQGGMVWVRSVIVTGTADTTTPRLHGVATVSGGVVGEAGTVFDALQVVVDKIRSH